MEHPYAGEDDNDVARHAGARVVLTRTAARYADTHDLNSRLERLALTGNVAVGDGVAVSQHGHRHLFRVIKRVWVETPAGIQPEITLDWPARL
jgi:hypothetical protein